MKPTTKHLTNQHGKFTRTVVNLPLLSTQAFRKLLIVLIILVASTMGWAQPTTPTAPAGAGTVANPYQISSLDNLYWIFWNKASGTYNKVYVQTANINASSTSTWNSGQGWIPIGHDDLNIFMGSYDGGGYSISGLYINNASRDYAGLFGYVGYNTIKRVYLTSVNIKGRHYVGALAGKANFSSTIEQCYSTGAVTGNTTTGGLIGAVNGDSGMSSTILKCYSSAAVNIDQVGGGLIGSVSSSTVSNCFSQGNVVRISGGIGTTNAGFISTNASGTIQYCYSTGSVTYTGATSPTNRGFIGATSGTPTHTANFYDSQTSAQSSGTGATAKTTAEMKTLSTFTSAGWDFLAETANGTNNYWGLDPNGNNGYPFLAWQPGLTHISAPIVTTQAATSISYTTATANGNITNLGYPNPTQYGHCWSITTNPTVANSKTEKGTASSTGAYTSALTGLNPNTTYYVRSYATNFTGTVYGTQVSFTTPQYFSGGAGTSVDPYLITTLADLQFLSENSSFWNKHFKQTANINASGTSTWNSGLGWIPIGNATTKFTGTYDGNGKTISGLTANRPSEHYVGFFGFIQGATVVVKNLGIISVNFTGNNYVGAIVGAIGTSASVTGCYSSGVVYGFNNAGGMVGYLTSGRVDNSYNWASVIRRSGSSGNVFGSFAGYVSATIEYCYTTGGVSVIDGTNLTGKGFAGNTAGSPVFTSNFFNTSTTSQATGTGATGKTTAEMKSQTTYTGWDFMSETTNGTNDYWGINPASNNGYPFLAWQGFTHVSSTLPTVTTASTTSITATTATGNGNITSLGAPNPTQHGHCWSLTASPTTANFKTEKGAASATGAYTSALTNLIPNTTYYIRAYATNTVGTAYGSELSFTTLPKTLTISGSFTVSNKIYNGNNSASFASNSLVLSGTLEGYSNVSLTNVVIQFSSKNVSENPISVTIISAELTGTDADRYTLSLSGAPTSSALITAKGVTVINAVAQNKIYDGNENATIANAAISGAIEGDNVVLSNHTSGVFDNKNVANSKPVTTAITLSGTDAGNYSITQPLGLTANITAKELTISGLTAANKIYDGNTNATLSGGTLVGKVGSDNVTATMPTAGTFAQATVGNGISVSISTVTLTGTAAGNYFLTQPTGITANITAKELTISGLTAANKIYNGNTNATLSGGTLVGKIESDNVTATMPTAGTFAQATVGNGISVSIPTITLSGTAAGNYYLTQPTGITANITAKELTISGLTAANKIYNGNTNATLSGGTLVGKVGTDNVTATMPTTGTFAQATVGNGISVSISTITLTGTAAGNYYLTQPTGISANITAKELTISGLTAANKIYDGNTNATLSGGTLVGKVGSDNVTATMPTAGTFVQATVGNGIAVSIPTITLTGTAAGNYFLTQPTGITANITAKQLTIGGSFTVSNKTYDGNSTATLSSNSLTLTGVVNSDAVSLTGLTVAFISSSAGANIQVNITSANLTGGAMGNYTLSLTGAPTSLASITPKALTVVSALAQNKTYDGTATATISGATLSGVIGGDIVNLNNHTSGIFAQVTVGNSISVTTNITLSGTSHGNYSVIQPSLSANITARSLTVTANSFNKTFGTAYNFSGTEFSTANLVSGDAVITVSLSSDGAAAGAGVGQYPITPSSAQGNGLSNYAISYVNGTMTVVAQTELTLIGIAASSKIYDGNANATISNWGTLQGIANGDVVSLNSSSAIALFDSKNAGSNKTVTISGLALSGTDANKYFINNHTTTATIDARLLSLSNFTANDKTYDGTNVVSGDGFSDNRIEGDDLEFSYSALFENKNAGESKTVNYTNIALSSGQDQANYTLNSNVGFANATIFAKEITITGSFTVLNKEFDGTTNATIDQNSLLIEDAVSNDLVALNPVAAFASANVGTDILVELTNATNLTGIDAPNYTLSLVNAPITYASITESPITYYTLTLTVNPSEAGITNGEGMYEAGHEVELEATANPGYIFLNWTLNGEEVSNLPNFTFTMPVGDTELVANFEVQFTVTFTILHGETPIEGAIVSINGEEITTNAEGKAIVQLINGNYSWEVSATGYISANGEVTVDGSDINETVSLSPVGILSGSISNVIAYPNPFRNTIHLENTENVSIIVITDLLGKVVINEKVNNELHIVNSNLKSGVYLLTLIGVDGSKSVRKMIRE